MRSSSKKNPTACASEVNSERLLRFLSNPKSYSDRPQHVQKFQTPTSWVFLTRHYAYKIKKPVDFGFLNFSTLEKRRYFCEREIILNRRLSPEVYLEVVPITLANQKLHFEACGKIVEYAVKMRRLSPRFFMDELLNRGKITKKDIRDIATKLVSLYRSQNPSPEITAWGSVPKLRITTNENLRQTKDCIGETITAPCFETLRFFINAFFRLEADLFKSRMRMRCIRDCHGDLHLDHIHIRHHPDRLAIFDCIEFNDRFRYIDIASDIAFLAMDLDFHERPDLARYLVSRISGSLRDFAMHRLLPFYKCHRAYVRGKVESENRNVSMPPSEKRKSLGRAKRYFQLSLRYATCGNGPMILIVMGRVGTGKSSLAARLAEELGWEVFSSDFIRKKLAGIPLQRRGDAVARKFLYSKRMTNRTYSAMMRSASECAAAGRGAILDATFGDRALREKLRRLLERKRLKYCFIEVSASDDSIKTRLAKRSLSRNVISDARLEDFHLLNARYEKPTELKNPISFSVKNTKSLEAAVTTALKTLAMRQIHLSDK